MKSKVADRIVVVTTASVIKLDNKFKVLKKIPLEQVSKTFLLLLQILSEKFPV